VLVVSHDRRLLENAVDSIYELEHGELEQYPGNFTAYIAQKDERFTSALRAWEEQQDFLRKEEAFIRKHMGSQRTAEAKGREKKLATLIAARTVRNVTVHLIDVSEEALDRASRTLGALPDLSVVAHQETYEEGLASLGACDAGAGPSLIAFLGSNIGNFDPSAADALLVAVRTVLRSGDSLLLGTDLVKPEPELVLAYDDPLGVTAAFNRNLLVRLNREIGSDFDLRGFDHEARWNADDSRMEMHLVSTRRQQVRIPAVELAITFEPGETIWTESSYKYRTGDLATTLMRAGFRVTGQWAEDGFALTLAEAE